MAELALRRKGGQTQRFVNYGPNARQFSPSSNWRPNILQTSTETLEINSKTSGSILLRSNAGAGSSAIDYTSVVTATVLISQIASGSIHCADLFVWLDSYEASTKTVKVTNIPVENSSGVLGTLDLTFRIVEPGETSLVDSTHGGVQMDWKFTKTTSNSITQSLQFYVYADNVSVEVR